MRISARLLQADDTLADFGLGGSPQCCLASRHQGSHGPTWWPSPAPCVLTERIKMAERLSCRTQAEPLSVVRRRTCFGGEHEAVVHWTPPVCVQRIAFDGPLCAICAWYWRRFRM